MKRTAPALLAVLAAGTLAMAQQGQPEKPATRTPPPANNRAQQQTEAPQAAPAEGRQERRANFAPAGAAHAQNLDAHIADCMTLANHEEIALLRFGAERAQNEQVKQFAEKAIQEHEKAIAGLKKFATSGANLDLQATSAAAGRAVATTREARKVNPDDAAAEQPAAKAADPNAQRPAATTAIARGEEAAAATQDGLAEQLLAINRKAHQECLKLTQQELQKYQGAKFDQAFLGQQVGMHIGMLAHLKAVEGSVSGELQQIVQQAQQTTQQHKQQAEELMEQVGEGEQGGQRREARDATREKSREDAQPNANRREPAQPATK